MGDRDHDRCDGDPGRRQLTMDRFYRVLSTLTLVLPNVALAASPRTFADFANLVVEILDNVSTVLIVLGIVIFFYGAATGIFKMGQGHNDTGKLRDFLIWGVGIIFVMVSVWGIIRLLQNTFFSGDATDPTNGTVGTETCGSFGSCGFGQ